VNVTSATDRVAGSVARRAGAAASRLWPPFVRRVARRYWKSGASTWATSISWNALASFVPIVLLLVSLLGFLYAIDRGFGIAVEARIARLGTTVVSRSEMRSALAAFRDHTGLIAGVGLVTLLWSGSGLFSAMDNALSDIYGVDARPYVRKRLRACGMTVLFTLLLTPLVVSAALLTEGRRFSLLPAQTPLVVLWIIQFVAGALDGALIFTAIYRLVPNRRLRLHRVLPGALFAGALLELVTLLFPLWLHLFDSAASYGVLFSAVVLLIAYFYLVGQITIVGALVNVELDHAIGAEEGAVRQRRT
jgi:membrane protein